MKLVTYGSADAPVIVLNNGSFCSERGLESVSRDLAHDFRVVVAVLDGNDGGHEPYVSTAHQARKILGALAEEGVSRIAVLQGVSMGAEVALEIVRQVEEGGGPARPVSDGANDASAGDAAAGPADADQAFAPPITIDHAFLDGGPFLHLNPLMRRIMLGKFRGLIGRMRAKSADASLASFRQSRMVNRILGTSIDGYEPMMRDFWQTAQTIDDEQVRGQVATCYTCDLPELSEECQRRMLFQWCEREKARDSERCVRDAYPHARFRIVPDLGHAGLVALRPHEYARQIRELASQG